MTADSLDLEDCNTYYESMIDSLTSNDMLNHAFLDSIGGIFDTPKLQPITWVNDIPSIQRQNSKYEDLYCDSGFSFKIEDYFTSVDDSLSDPYRMRSSSFDMSLQNSSLLDLDPECLTATVSPDLVLPISSLVELESIPALPVIEETGDGALNSVWEEFSEMATATLSKLQSDDNLKELPIDPTFDELFKKKKRRKLTHLDFDHCYSQRPIQEDDDEEDDDDDDFDFDDLSPYSPASSCSDKGKGVKRSRPKRKAGKQIKIKQEIISSDEEEVDVETPCPNLLVVPKLTISLAPPPVKTGPAKRGRKPKNKTQVQTVKKSNNKNCPISPRDLQAAIKQQKQKCYITKSGRVSNKISNSVETTPSTSTHSSLSNSRCNSDNEDSIDKRASHNMAERNRRQELTNLFQNLRKNVPEIEKNTKASKVLILQSSSTYIGTIQRTKRAKVSQIQHLQAEMERNLARIQRLL